MDLSNGSNVEKSELRVTPVIQMRRKMYPNLYEEMCAAVQHFEFKMYIDSIFSSEKIVRLCNILTKMNDFGEYEGDMYNVTLINYFIVIKKCV